MSVSTFARRPLPGCAYTSTASMLYGSIFHFHQPPRGRPLRYGDARRLSIRPSTPPPPADGVRHDPIPLPPRLPLGPISEGSGLDRQRRGEEERIRAGEVGVVGVAGDEPGEPRGSRLPGAHQPVLDDTRVEPGVLRQ